MNLRDFYLLKEDQDAYVIGHPKGKSMRVSKSGLSDRAQKLISGLKREQHLADGGEVLDPLAADSIEDSPEQIASDAQAQAPQSAPQITAQDEISAAPPQAAPAPQAPPVATDPGAIPDTTGALGAEKKAIQAGAGAEAAEGAANEAAYGQYARDVASMPTPQDIFKKYQAADDDLQKAYLNQKLDPDRYLHNMSTGSKIAAGLGMVLGGIGSGLTGQPNLAAQVINNAIERDIEAQKNDQSKAMNLWKMNREALQDENQATLATQNQLLNGVKAKAMAAAARAQGPVAAARVAPLISQIDQQIASNNQIRSLLKVQSQGGFVQADPAQLVPYLVKNPEQQKQVYEEIGRAQNVSRNSQKMLQAFDQAASQIKILPGDRSGVKEFHQLLLPNFKQVDGTVRQAAMDETFHNLTPQFADSAETLATKRQGLRNWMHSETAAPVAKGNHLDLSRFSTTSSDARAQFTPQQSAIYHEAQQRLAINPQDPFGLAAIRKLGVQ